MFGIFFVRNASVFGERFVSGNVSVVFLSHKGCNVSEVFVEGGVFGAVYRVLDYSFNQSRGYGRVVFQLALYRGLVDICRNLESLRISSLDMNSLISLVLVLMFLSFDIKRGVVRVDREVLASVIVAIVIGGVGLFPGIDSAGFSFIRYLLRWIILNYAFIVIYSGVFSVMFLIVDGEEEEDVVKKIIYSTFVLNFAWIFLYLLFKIIVIVFITKEIKAFALERLGFVFPVVGWIFSSFADAWMVGVNSVLMFYLYYRYYYEFLREERSFQYDLVTFFGGNPSR